ncbi:FAD-dependent oxidoreductase (plasmid) [Rhizobium rhizogenes]|uniref:FAD-dependent oxidoreductase n=1 Tax=Rhizobium rhizogenes TaxID=359 RepID=UPI0009BE946E|nr:FAD-dependent oxidoreductase [Agrobacterium fabrum]NTI85379.1 FAD-dependent oxidoreductase [Rhizobium rhizogenes]NTJ27562.1 FAD-dependent oxidoreductase [Rhizobium rhizogenes]QRM41751.1 FAD-dependent oxidoreductase [Rhizobium rhizogenes]QUE85007.1 FAD-dependent oxidoreductase [Rhizobium rhizogenes]
MYGPADGRAEPSTATPAAIARAALRAGARVHTRTSVRGIELSARRVSAILLDCGRLECSQVVLAGGAWSSGMLRTSVFGFLSSRLLCRR